LKTEALELRNRLLHFRLCEFFKVKTDMKALIAGVEPRLNQTALSLLSLIDDAQLRSDVQKVLLAQNEDAVAQRRETDEARVVAAIVAAFVSAPGKDVPVGEIARRFNHETGEGFDLRSRNGSDTCCARACGLGRANRAACSSCQPTKSRSSTRSHIGMGLMPRLRNN